MNSKQSEAEFFCPSGGPISHALARTTHLCVVAHPDDAEIMAPQAILECRGSRARHLTVVVLTDGVGSPRSGRYFRFSAGQMAKLRVMEQKKAARIGKYNLVVFLGYSSAEVKRTAKAKVVAALVSILKETRPETVSTHNPADRHDTHVAVCLRLISAIRKLPAAERPKHLYGLEVWGDLDWMVERDRLAWDVSRHLPLQAELIRSFRSQVVGGKRYVEAAIGRRRAHATFLYPDRVDACEGISLGMNLSALVRDERMKPETCLDERIDRFRDEMRKRLRRIA